MKFLDKLKEALKKVKKVIVYEVEPTPEQIRRYLPDAYKKTLARERARADRLEEKVKKLEEEIERLRGKLAEKEMEEAWLIEKQIKEERRRRTKFFRFDRRLKILILSLDKLEPFKDAYGVRYPYWAGIYVKKMDGEEYKGLIVRNKKGQESMLPPVPRSMFEQLFPETFLEDCLRGRLVINMASDGTFLPPRMEVVQANPKEWIPEVKQSFVSIRSIFKRADADTKKLILSLYQQINDLWAKVRDVEMLNAELTAKKLESDLTSTTAMRVTEGVVPGMAVLANKLENIVGRLAPLRIKEQEAMVRFAGAEKMASTAWETTEALVNKLKELAYELEVSERQKLIEEMRELLTGLIKKKESEKGE